MSSVICEHNNSFITITVINQYNCIAGYLPRCIKQRRCKKFGHVMYLRKSVNMSCDPVSAVSIMTVKQLLTANHS